MCIAIWAKGHLVIDHLLETIWPRVNDKHGSVRNCIQTYDLVVRNVGDEPITEIVVIHPRRILDCDPPTDGPIRPEIKYCATGLPYADKLFRRRPTVNGDQISFNLRRTSDSEPAARDDDYTLIRAKHFEVKLVTHPIIAESQELSDAIRDDIRFQSVTRLVLNDGSSPHLEPYDGSDEDTRASTRYFLRLTLNAIPFQPVASHNVSYSTSGNSNIIKDWFEICAAPIFHRSLRNRLHQMIEGDNNRLSEAAQALQTTIYTDGIENPENTVRVVDHRLAVVTDSRCAFDHCHHQGNLRFWQVRGLDIEPNDGLTVNKEVAHIWLAGATWFPFFDPERLARSILDVFQKFPIEQGNRGHSIESLLAITQSPDRQNVIVVLESLEDLEILERGDPHGQQWRVYGTRDMGPESTAEAARNMYNSLSQDNVKRDLRSKLVRVPDVTNEFNERPFVLHFSTEGRARS